MVDQSKKKFTTLDTLEIERKYLVNSSFLVDKLDSFPNFKIFQGYVVVGDDGRELRLRAKGDIFYLTIKGAGQLARFETEIEITQDQFDALWPATDGRQVEKTRYAIAHGDLTIDLDVYEGHLDGLITAEVEFPSELDSIEFTPPGWFGEEVTHDDRYKNISLAIFGMPRRATAVEVSPGSSEETLKQAGAVPFRIREGRVEFCLITSMNTDKWGIPKGIIDHGQTAIDAALYEAHEEAGVRGRVIGEPLGNYEYVKWGKTLDVSIMLLEVTKSERDWPEAELRLRRWMSYPKARRLARKKQRRFLKAAKERIETLYPDSSVDNDNA